jgi:hypothetical protein
MITKHKVLKDFQFLTEDKKIIILKAKTIIENYTYKLKTGDITVSKEIINNNPDYFSFIDWKEDLQTYLKANKIAQPAVITKKLVPFVENLLDTNSKVITKEILVETPVEVKVKENNVDSIQLQLELETKIKKTELQQSLLNDEIEQTNKKELEYIKKLEDLNKTEKDLNKKKTELQNLENSLEETKKDLEEREKKMEEFKTEFDKFILKEDAKSLISKFRGVALTEVGGSLYANILIDNLHKLFDEY